MAKHSHQILGERIVARREDRRWDQKTLAEHAEINAGYLSMIERGLKAPSIGTLHKLRRALSLSDAEFLGLIDLLQPEREGNGGEAA